jgi:hypothetical protein
MMRCERCNACQSQWDMNNCKRCNHPGKDTRGPSEIAEDEAEIKQMYGDDDA